MNNWAVKFVNNNFFFIFFIDYITDTFLFFMQLGFSVIHPCCRFRFYWDAMMLSMLLIDINLLPLKIAFFHESHNGFLIALEYSFKVIRLVDIAMNFRTGIIKVRDKKLWARSYTIPTEISRDINYVITWIM